MKRKIFVNGDMTGKGIPKLAVLQYKKDKFEGYIYGDTKNEEKSFKASLGSGQAPHSHGV